MLWRNSKVVKSTMRHFAPASSLDLRKSTGSSRPSWTPKLDLITWVPEIQDPSLPPAARRPLRAQHGFDAPTKFGLGHAGGPVHPHNALAVDQYQRRRGAHPVAQHHGFAYGMRRALQRGVGCLPHLFDLRVFLLHGRMVDLRHLSVTTCRRHYTQTARFVLLLQPGDHRALRFAIAAPMRPQEQQHRAAA